MVPVRLLETIVKDAKANFSLIDKDHPGFKSRGYLVLSSRFGQCDLTCDPLKILKDFQVAFVFDTNFDWIKNLMHEKKSLPEGSKAIASLDKEILKVSMELNLKKDITIEIRWSVGHLDYKFINLVMQHEIIDRDHTKSPLAIVLKSFSSYAE